MVSADNVNYDVLSLIFAFLGNTDLVSVCLVSRSFRIGATPRLYRSVYFRLINMKRWPGIKVASPFTTIISHPSLGVHVRYCDIKAVPKIKEDLHPAFIASCAESLALCPYLISFTCISDVPPFIPLLTAKERLIELKIHAALSTEQALSLLRIRGLCTLSLYQASWNICHMLSHWISNMTTLTSLTLANSRYLNEAVLSALTPYLSTIRGLHIVGCPQVSHHAVLRSVSRTPLLESLSLSTWENSSTSSTNLVSLPYLRHLSLDTRCTFSPHTVHGLYSSLFTALASCPLNSLTFKLSERIVVGDDFIEQVIHDHGTTLTRFNAINVSLTDESIENICAKCEYLEQLAVVVPVKRVQPFSEALSYACNLHTLVDVGDSHTAHGPRMSLSAGDVREIFQSTPTLRTVISGNRCWTCERIPAIATEHAGDDRLCFHDQYCFEDEIKLKLKRLKSVGGAAYDVGDGGG